MSRGDRAQAAFILALDGLAVASLFALLWLILTMGFAAGLMPDAEVMIFDPIATTPNDLGGRL